ncbi:sensor domain-containing diguanylate cyclase [Natronospora cellulosivora (SeqCode)]
MKILKNNRFIIYIISVFIFIFFTIAFTYNIFNGSRNTIKIEEFTIRKIDYVNFNEEEIIHDYNFYELKTYISYENFTNLTESDNYQIVINRLAAKWYAIYFNGQLLGTYGDQNNYSNIWNTVELYNLHSKLIEDKNEIKILINNFSEPGISYPILITESREGHLIESWDRQILENINVLSIGFNVFSFIILIALYKKSKKSKKEYLYLAIACFALSLGLLQSLNFPFLLFSGLIFRKISVASMYLAVFAFSMSIFEEYKSSRVNKILAYFSLLSFLIIMFSPAKYFAILDESLAIIIAINILSCLYTSAKNIKKSDKARLFFFSILFSTIPVFFDLILLFNNTLVNFHYSLIGIFIFSFSIIFYLVSDYTALLEEVYEHKKIAKVMYNKSIRDSMTGIYNHGYITSTLSNTKDNYSLIIMDVDNFKDINDKYGHQAGDDVIKHVAQTINKRTRKSDIVGRYGGDEFIIIIFNAEQKDIEKIANKIKRQIEKPFKSIHGKINITVSMGIYNKEKSDEGSDSLLNADKALYYVKNNGKGNIKIYDSDSKSFK